MTRHCLFCIAALALLAASLSSCKEEPVVEEVIRPVRYEVATLGAEATARSFAGVARSGVESRLSFRVSGNVFELPVSVGDTVEEGDLIAQLDTADYEVALQQAEAAVSAARATQRNAEAEFERIGRLFENGTASRSEFDAARAAADSARAMVRANRQQVQAARDQITYCTLLAPNAGAIAEVLVEVNENVESGQPIVVLTGGSDENLEVETPVPGQLIARLSRGMMTTVTFNGVPGQVFEAEITEVGVVAAGGTTFPVTVRLLEVHPGIRAGMTAEVTFPFEPSSETPRILLDGRPDEVIAPAPAGRTLLGSDPFAEPEGGDPILDAFGALLDEEPAPAVPAPEPARARTRPQVPPLSALEPERPRSLAERMLDEADLRRIAALERMVAEPTGYDRFGLSPAALRSAFPLFLGIYRLWFRVRSQGIENLPASGGAVLAGNHGGLLPFDAAMTVVDVLLHTDPPRLARAVVDRWAGRLPWVNVFYARVGQVVGTAENVADL
ncbi:MAG: efflux RND transporter periplasmic adaptor subunit, partial [Thermoanaerobaculia bacterium]|nr:efflux RND transporter periplasmic adaptor subunit [Thermoanaerobaculia bacterium]